ncbi:SPFH domain-containing protein [Nonomuraea sp. H19]|uniref:SPFH domain-containing protein n=1 Tax=Nonomuraea sp. H19 TaxID=3452206 RepID=UPI003F8A51B1
MIIFTLVLLALVGGAGYIAFAGRLVVPENHVGVVTRRLGRKDAAFPRVAPGNTKGVQARALAPGLVTWMPPGLYSVEYVESIRIPAGMIGLVTAHEGRPRPRGQALGRYVKECDNFQDGQAFLLNGGEQGRQVATLDGDTSYLINTRLFTVELVPRTYVPRGTVGLVHAKEGRIPPSDRPFGRHVECDHFQDGAAFLDSGGEQGKQLAVLPGGASYDINPWLFKVITVENVDEAEDGLTAEHLKEVAIRIGYTGVVITLDGAQSTAMGRPVEGHSSFRKPWEFLARGGTRGVQEETLKEGSVLALNPWFVRVVPIPTRVMILEWRDKIASESRNFDAELGRIVVTVQGYQLHVDMDQTLRIPESAAPRLVSEFGGTGDSPLGGLYDDPRPVQRFVERVLGSTVAAYFSGMATSGTIDGFLRRYTETRTAFAAKVRAALEEWGVEALQTNLGSVEAADPKLNALLQETANEQLRGQTLQITHSLIRVEEEIDKAKALSEIRHTALDTQAEVGALGRETYALIQLADAMSRMKPPEIVTGAAGDSDLLPLMALRDMLGRLREVKQDNQQLEQGE